MSDLDPEGFVAGLQRPVLIDEVQRGGPDLLLAIKSAVDKDKVPGQFFLTGSANVLANRKVLETVPLGERLFAVPICGLWSG